MKLISVASLIIATFAFQSPQIQIHDSEEGICSLIPTSCPTSKQRKGVCCNKGPNQSLGYYDNFCQACIAGCDTYVFRRRDGNSCSQEDL